jgi:hemoglobin
MTGESIYDRLGKENLSTLIDTFYDKVISDERINHLFTTDINEVKRKQFMFLSQFFGGPPLYVEEFGHPKMRMRHLPHKITESAAVAWLDNMAQSINQLPIGEEFKAEIYQRFPHLAAHMVNSSE